MSTVKTPLLNASFQVNIGSSTYSFARIRNISEVLEVESIQEGGSNWRVHNLAKPLSSSQKLVLERGFLADGGTGPALRPGARVFDVTIMVMQHGNIKKSYSFEEGIVTRWDISDFDALQGQAIYKTIEITHSGLHEVPLP